jgi:hypothetical protein
MLGHIGVRTRSKGVKVMLEKEEKLAPDPIGMEGGPWVLGLVPNPN